MDTALSNFSQYSGLYLVGGIFGILIVLLFPIPKVFLDFLLGYSLSISFMVLISTLFITNPLELSIFPTILLITTLIRLSLNIATTRLILAHGHEGDIAAGNIIRAFGNFVMQGNVVIGLIVFLILTLINFIVITKGSGRIAEVAARFALDSMPGKQMSIDSDLNNGLITEEQAQSSRKNLNDESSFYGAMDGANKFVRGDAIAGLVITFINLIGGIIVGIVQKNLSFSSAITTYSILTIGDGLVSQIPSLLISLSAGLLVTKAESTTSTDKLIFSQLGQYPIKLFITAIIVLFMGFLPGLPFFIFAFIAFSIASLGYFSTRVQNKTLEQKSQNLNNAETQHSVLENILLLDVVKLELGKLIGYLIIDLDSDFSKKVNEIRYFIAQKYGFIIDKIKLDINNNIGAEEYLIKIYDVKISKSYIKKNHYFAFSSDKAKIDSLEGEDSDQRLFSLNEKWVPKHQKEKIQQAKVNFLEYDHVIILHLKNILNENIFEFLSYDITNNLLLNIDPSNKSLVKYIVPEIASVATIQKILKNLLIEFISIKNLPMILEAIAEIGKSTQDISSITEFVRIKLSRQISNQHSDKDGIINVILLSTDWENVFLNHVLANTQGQLTDIKPSQIQEFIEKLGDVFSENLVKSINYRPILMVNAKIRPYVSEAVKKFFPSIFVMSYKEVHVKVKTNILGYV